MARLLASRPLRQALAAALYVAGPAFLVLTGIVGVGRRTGAHFAWDMAVLYFAGKIWWTGRSPYDRGRLAELIESHHVAVAGPSFAYPPQAAPLSMLLALGDLDQARIVYCALNLAAVAAISILAVKMAREVGGRPLSALATAFTVAVVFGNPFVSHALWLGQTSVLVTAAILGAFVLATRGADGRAALLLGFSTFKPTLSLLPTLWWLLRRRFRLCLGIGAVSLLLAAYPLILLGPLETLAGWWANLAGYRDFSVNRLGDRDVMGIQSALAAFGMHVPTLLPVGLVAAGLLAYWHDRFHPYEVLALLACCTMLFAFGHSYDLIALAPALAVLVPAASGSKARLLLGLGLLAALCFPARFVDALGVPPLAHWRNAVVLAIGLWILFERPRRVGGEEGSAPRHGLRRVLRGRCRDPARPALPGPPSRSPSRTGYIARPRRSAGCASRTAAP